MTDTPLARGTLLILIALAHGAIFWWLSWTTPTTPPVAPVTVVAMLLSPSEESRPPQPASKPAPPAPQPPPHITPKSIQPAPDTPTRPPQPETPVQENVIPSPPVSVPSDPVPAISAPPPPPAPPPPASPPRFDAAYLNNPVPAYPPAARRMGVQGTVLLRVQVSTDGTALEVQLNKTSGSPALDQAALAAVRKWRFIPAMQGTEAVADWVLVPVSFKIN